ncbi:Hypothetical protein D9617_65g035150 [Elsinoe fawcettii]|nr:Hypothetical protein D9617_65g035150 [Elsinoe fawcettii]
MSDRSASESSDADLIEKESLLEEMKSKWILNLYIQFDDDRQEKLLITHVDESGSTRKVTVTWNTSNLRHSSLESDLDVLLSEEDKHIRVYQSLRESLQSIQFLDSVTKLELETDNEGCLHIHVSEDADEIIEYPSSVQASHVPCQRYEEREISIETQLSGFVYKVLVNGKEFVEKEIPGPDDVERFVHEMNALSAFSDEDYVIDLHGIVTNDKGDLIKGILIPYASQGCLYDIIHTHQAPLAWSRRRRWAGQVISGLSSIHESGFVQGDFTLRNIVIDDKDNACIIDMSRRGCRKGWAPPELARWIGSGQNIGMLINMKTDL